MKVPNYMWGEAIQQATYIINRVPTRALLLQTPYEAYKGRKPKVDHLKIFGCKAYVKTEEVGLKKLDDRSRPLVYLGTEPGFKAYRLYNPETRKVVVSKHVVFNEESGWEWDKDSSKEDEGEPGKFKLVWGESFDDGSGTIETNTEDDVDPTNSSTQSAQEQIPSNTSSVSSAQSQVQVSHGDQAHNNHNGPRRSARQSVPPRYFDDFVMLAGANNDDQVLLANVDEPRSYKEAKDSIDWKKAMVRELESIEKKKFGI